jgi:hypothetical protein
MTAAVCTYSCSSFSPLQPRVSSRRSLPAPSSQLIYQDHIYTIIHLFLWPKLTFDFLTTTLNPLVKPIPFLQIFSLVLAFLILALEWPAPILFKYGSGGKTSGSSKSEGGYTRGMKKWHSRIETRLVVTLPLAMFVCALGYQTVAAGMGYAIAWGFWWVGFVEGEVCFYSFFGASWSEILRGDKTAVTKLSIMREYANHLCTGCCAGTVDCGFR